MMKKNCKGGVKVGLNGNVAVQTKPGSKGVGPTKTEKATVQKTPGSKGVGKSKTAKAVVSPKK